MGKSRSSGSLSHGHVLTNVKQAGHPAMNPSSAPYLEAATMVHLSWYSF